MKTITVISVFYIFILVAIASNGAEPVTIEEYVSDFLRLYPDRNELAQRDIIYIRKESARHSINPAIVAVMVSKESGWRSGTIGGIGEIGVMQVHGVCATGQDLTTRQGQLKAGIECLARSREACDGSDREMVTMYASGKCKSRSKRTQALVNRRLRIARGLI